MGKSLVQQTREMLKAQRRLESRASIAANAGVNPHWLEKFDQGVLLNPTTQNLERLRGYLHRAEAA